MNPDEIAELAWPAASFSEATESLARSVGLISRQPPVAVHTLAEPASLTETGAWIQWTAGRLGLEAEPVIAPVANYAGFLQSAGPALLYVPHAKGPLLLLLIGCRRGTLRLLTPKLKIAKKPVAFIRFALCSPRQARVTEELDRLFVKAGVSVRRKKHAIHELLREHFAGVGESGCWLLRLPASSSFPRQMHHAQLPLQLIAFLMLYILIYAIEIAAWTVLGYGTLNGHLDIGWFSAWVLLLITIPPLEFAAGGLNSTFTLGASRLLKQRLLAGALQTNLERLRQYGAGQLLGQVIESQVLESQILNGGLSTLVAILELLLAAWVMTLGSSGLLHPVLLFSWSVVAVCLALRYEKRLAAWTDERLDQTHELIERMHGHRTCLAQEHPERRDRLQDHQLSRLLESSADMDRTAVPLSQLLSRGWILLACTGLAPDFATGNIAPVDMAVNLGGILLAARAFARIADASVSLVRAGVAWRQIRFLFRAGARHDAPPMPSMVRTPSAGRQSTAPSGRLLEGYGIEFRYRSERDALLRIDKLVVQNGERILLEGPSGGGKSTLVSLLVGLRQPDSGVLLLDGLDWNILGNAWRRRVVAAPQFHENHIFGGSLAFNLLMGRGWPASNNDLAAAEVLCRELGLGELLDRMPSGIMQIVGETGWQLSHGERSRVYLARALLQNAELTILDESFAALDPETLSDCLKTVLARTNTLVVVAHP